MWFKKRFYFDTAAGRSANPSSPHEEGRRARKMIEDARKDIARLVEVQTDDIIFTSGATEANALAILGHVRALRLAAGPDKPGRNNMHVLYLPSSHASIVENMRTLAGEGVAIEALPIKNFRVDTDALAKMIRPETVFISMDAVCGETGVLWNTREVAGVLKKARGGKATFSLARGTAATREENDFAAVLHVDASQAPLTEKITRAHFDADMLTLDASKVGTVRGVGALVAHRTIPLHSLYAGGGQERSIRPGSEAPELIREFAASLQRAVREREAFRTAAGRARTELTKRIAASVRDAVVNEGTAQAPHILNISLLGRDTDYLVAVLDEAGFAVSTRSACETDSEEGSRAVLCLTGDVARARSTLRISWGPGVRRGDFTALARALIAGVAFVDNGEQR